MEPNVIRPDEVKTSQSNKIALTIAGRDAIAESDRFEGMLAYVTDASADSSVTSGMAGYQLVGGITNSDWVKVWEGESLDLNLDTIEEGAVNKYFTETLKNKVDNTPADTNAELDNKSDKLSIQSKSGAYSLQNSDVNSQIRVTGTTTITLPDGLTWNTNDGVEIVNVGENTVTLTLGASTTINGVGDDITLESYESLVVMKLSGNDYLGTGKV